MKLTVPETLWDSNRGFLLYSNCILIVLTTSRTALLLGLLAATFFCKAQSISPSTINISGQSATFGNYQFEWSIGESASITTMTNSNLVVTSGVLQSFVAYQPELNDSRIFLPGEIKVYPNPTRDIIEINVLHLITGKNKLELFDMQGKKVMEKQFESYGSGAIEKWDLSKLTSGNYFLHIRLTSPVTGATIKQGAFKIYKIK